jgi:hypothetical protein
MNLHLYSGTSEILIFTVVVSLLNTINLYLYDRLYPCAAPALSGLAGVVHHAELGGLESLVTRIQEMLTDSRI